MRFSREFYHFTREWPSILSVLLVNTPDEDDAANLTTILVSDLGDDNPRKRHERLYRSDLRSLKMEPMDNYGLKKLKDKIEKHQRKMAKAQKKAGNA